MGLYTLAARCAPGTEPPGVLRVEAGKIPKKGCKVKTNGTRYNPADVVTPGGKEAHG